MRMVDVERSSDGRGESTQSSMTMGNALEDEIEEKAMHSGQSRTLYSLVSTGNAILNDWETTGSLSNSL